VSRDDARGGICRCRPWHRVGVMRGVGQWYLRRLDARWRVTTARLWRQTAASLIGAAAAGFFSERAIEDRAYVVAVVVWSAWTVVWLSKLRRSFLLVMGEALDAREIEAEAPAD
jgi:hypothetical protein